MGIEDFESLVSAALPGIVALVPKEPAARLGKESSWFAETRGSAP